MTVRVIRMEILATPENHEKVANMLGELVKTFGGLSVVEVERKDARYITDTPTRIA